MLHRKIAAVLVLLATTAMPFTSPNGSSCQVERKRFEPTGKTTPEQMREFCIAAEQSGQNIEDCDRWTSSGVLPELKPAGGDTANVENCQQPDLPSSGCRKAWQWPCATDSFFNIPIGSGAQFSEKSDPRVASLLKKGKVNLNTTGWSTAVYKAEDSDPELTFSPSGVKFKGPLGMKPAMRGLSAGDGQVNIVQPDDNTNYETEFTRIPSDGDTTIFHDKMLKVNKLRTSQCVGTKMGDYTGRWVYGGTSIAGLIRQWEMEGKNEVRHALNLGVCWEQLKNGPVWPATCQDGGCMKDNDRYTGAINMGTVFAIPPTVDIESLGLNQYSKKIAYAAQRYGVVVVAQACGPAMYGEQILDQSIASAIQGDLFKILQQLVVLTNVSQAAPKGGGTTSIPPAPPFCAPGGGDSQDPGKNGNDQPKLEPQEVNDLDRLLKKCEGLDERDMVDCVLRIAEDWQ